MSANPQTCLVTCVTCNAAKTRSKLATCADCRPPIEPAKFAHRACTWCGGTTRAVDAVCLSCRPFERMSRLAHSDSASVALTGGTWHPRPGGIKVWISWDEDIA